MLFGSEGHLKAKTNQNGNALPLDDIFQYMSLKWRFIMLYKGSNYVTGVLVT